MFEQPKEPKWPVVLAYGFAMGATIAILRLCWLIYVQIYHPIP